MSGSGTETRTVTIERDMPAYAAARSRLASRPLLVLPASPRTELSSRRIDSSSAVPLPAHATISSHVPEALAPATVAPVLTPRGPSLSVDRGTTV